MRSIQAFTKEIDDLERAVEELKQQIDPNLLLKNTCGLVFCGYETNVDDLAKVLKRKFDFPFIGCTAIGMLITKGYTQSSISLLVLTADDCDFSLGICDEMYCTEEIGNLSDKYKELAEKLPEKPKLILAYSAWNPDIEADSVVETLDEVSGGVPVFGGISSDGWSFNEDKIFCGNEVSRRKVAMILISGNVNPIFTIAHSIKKSSYMNKLVTRSKENVVYTIDDQPIVDYLEENGFIADKTDVMIDYLATPFKVTLKVGDNDEIDVLRCLVSIDHKKKACRFIGKIPEDSEMNMVLLSKKDIEASAKATFREVIEKMNKCEDYEYSTILCSSCLARYSLIVSDKNVEGRAYAYKLPENVNMCGYYGGSEYCPAVGKKSGKLRNVLNNESLTLVAF